MDYFDILVKKKEELEEKAKKLYIEQVPWKPIIETLSEEDKRIYDDIDQYLRGKIIDEDISVILKGGAC